MVQRLRSAGVALALLLAGPAFGTPQTFYQNTDGPLFAPAFPLPHSIDDGSFLTPLDHPPIRINTLNFAFFVLGSTPASFDLRLRFYDTLTPFAQPQADVNSELLASITVPIRDAMPGIRATGMLDIPSLLGQGILFTDSEWALEAVFLSPGATTLSDRATPLFAGGEPLGGPRVGGSQDLYWRDVNNNGRVEVAESGWFDGAPHRANFYLQMQGEPVPEPVTPLLIAAALLLHSARRVVARTNCH